jgi:predicted Zn-dependent peptidase
MKITNYEQLNEAVYFTELPNGLPVYVVPKKGYRSTYANFVTRYGGCDRRFTLGGEKFDTPAGIAHFLEHKMFDLPDGTNALQLLAGANPNAYTSNGITAYHVNCSDDFERYFRILLNYVSTPYFTDESVNKERGIIAQEIKMGEDSPGNAVFYNLMKALYANHTVQDNIAGTVESIGEIDAKTLYACHKVFYNPANMVLCVSGDVDAERIAAIAEELLPKEKGEVPARDYGAAELPTPKQAFIDDTKAVGGLPLFLIGAKATLTSYTGDAYALDGVVAGLAASCFAGNASPLYAKLYASGMINKNFGCGFYDFPQGSIIYAEGESAEPLKIRDELAAEAVRISRDGVDPKLLERQKKGQIGGMLRALDNEGSICEMQTDGHFHSYDSFKLIELADKITADDVSGFIAKTFKADNLATSVVHG